MLAVNRVLGPTLAAIVTLAWFATAPTIASAAPPPHYPYWEGRRDPPPGHALRPAPPRPTQWDRRDGPPPGWGRGEWALRQSWLRRHGHDRYDHDSTTGLIAGAILGFVLGAAISDTKEQQSYADTRLNDPAWIAYCARKYASFDPYSGTYLGADGLRHYCR